MTMFADSRYETAKLLLNQIVMSVFGWITAMATTKSVPLTIVCAVLGIGLYVFLIYNMMWEIGAKDSIKASAGRYEYKAAKPFLMALKAGCINITGGLLCLFALAKNAVCDKIAYVGFTACKVVWGHFLGFGRVTGLINQGYENPFFWLFVAMFAILITVLGYNAGFRGISLIPALHKSKKDKE